MTVTELRPPEPPDDPPEVYPRRPVPKWILVGLAVAAAIALTGVGLIVWSRTHPAGSPAKLAITAAYAPAGTASPAQVYFTVTNTGDQADVLTSAGSEFQTAQAAKSVSVCGDAACQGDTATVPGHGSLVFGSGGPHLLVAGLGALRVGRAPLQLTLSFQHSGVVHVLVPVGSPSDLTELDVINYGYMGHRDPGMMGGSEMPAGSSGMSGMGTAPTPSPAPKPSATGMPGMSMPAGG